MSYAAAPTMSYVQQRPVTYTQPVATQQVQRPVTYTQPVQQQVQQVQRPVVQQQVQYVQQAVPQTTKLTGSVTIPKVNTVMEQQSVENKVPKYDYDIRSVSCPKTIEVEKTIMETKLVAIQVPKVIKVPQQIFEERSIKIPKPVFEKKKTIKKVARMVYDDVEEEYTEQVYETKTSYVSVPKQVTTYETVQVEHHAVVQPQVTQQVPVQQQQFVTQPLSYAPPASFQSGYGMQRPGIAGYPTGATQLSPALGPQK
jgi:hypothetical protein